jgi:hypothetical protein
MAKRRKQTGATPFRPCGMCHNGFVYVTRGSERAVARCLCWKLHKSPSPTEYDAKTAASGR